MPVKGRGRGECAQLFVLLAIMIAAKMTKIRATAEFPFMVSFRAGDCSSGL